MTLLRITVLAASAGAAIGASTPRPRGGESAVPATVTKIEMVARPKTYSGACPATIKFTGAIHVSAFPVTVEYQWERSDGAKGPKRKVVIRGAGLGVNDTWTLGAAGQSVTVGEKLHVLAPNDLVSEMVSAKVACQ